MIRRTLLLSISAACATLPLGLSVGAQAKPAAAPARAVAKVPSTPMMASADPALFKGLSYRLVGHSRGGRVTSVTGVPSQPKTFYAGVASGGVMRTTNGAGVVSFPSNLLGPGPHTIIVVHGELPPYPLSFTL